MFAIKEHSHIGYPDEMTEQADTPKKPEGQKRKLRATTSGTQRPNRITEVAHEQGLTYAEIAERTDAHAVTIAKLANGTMKLTQEWMNRLATAMNVPPQNLIIRPPHNLRAVPVRGTLKAGYWAETVEWDPSDWEEVFIPDEPRDKGLNLYAGKIVGNSMNLRYADGSFVILVPIIETRESLIPGRRYHVRRTRADGMVEETIKMFHVDAQGGRWFRPESDDPEHQAWIPARGSDGETIEVIGRVTFAVQREP